IEPAPARPRPPPAPPAPPEVPVVPPARPRPPPAPAAHDEKGQACQTMTLLPRQPAPAPVAQAWGRRHRKGPPPRPRGRSERPADEIVGRLLRRGAACVLCGRWPAPRDRRIHGRLVLLCSACDRRPDAGARLEEMIQIDWSRDPKDT